MVEQGQNSASSVSLERSHERDWPEFLDRLVHDLREPLRSVNAFTELLGELAKGNLGSDGDHMIGEILSGASRMRTLIDGVSGYSLALQDANSVGSASLQLAFDLAVDGLQEEIRASGATITADSLPRLSIGLERLIQLMQNLIGNSLRFRGEDAPLIHVSAVRQDSDLWLVRVEDNGIGVAPQDLAKIFEPFIRIYGRKYPGAGMGLAICRAIVEKHGGRIWMESAPASGSACCFTLPEA